MKSSLALAIAPFVLASAPALAGWEATDANLGTIVMGIDMMDTQTGLAAGAANGSGPMIWKTTDGGDSWRVLNNETLTMSYMDISMGDENFGVTGGMGAFFVWAGSTRTVDGGRTWSKSGGPQFFSVYQDVEAIDGTHAALVGSWGGVRASADGIAYTSDRGRSWEYFDWGVDTWARYVSFPTPEVGYISGGEWPTESARSLTGWQGRAISQHVTVPMTFDLPDEKTTGTGYRGAVARTEDHGQTWEVMLDVDGVYFNGINFVDELNGWVVGEGADTASIYHTADGGLTWEEQWTGEATLMQIKMVDELTGWAGGGDLSGRRPGALILHTTDGGQTWTPDAIDGDFILFNIDAMDADHAMAVGYNLSTGNCGVLRYSN